MQDQIQINDIEKWLVKLESVIHKVETFDSKGEEMLANVKAYMSDSRYFLQQNNLVLSFEAMVHAFAVFETCKELGLFEVSQV